MKKSKNDLDRGSQWWLDEVEQGMIGFDPSDDEPDVYDFDPGFKPFPRKTYLVPKGFPADPAEREILRKLHLQCLHGSVSDITRILPRDLAMSPQSKRQLSRLQKECAAGDSTIWDALWNADYHTIPPAMEEFLEKDYYLGSALRPASGGKGLWPVWRKELIEGFDRHSFTYEAVFTGAIGIGKSYAMQLLLLYRLCQFACLRDPLQFLGLAPSSGIDFVLLSISRRTARNTVWNQLRRLMGASPFFRDRLGYNPHRDYASLEMKLPMPLAQGRPIEVTISAGSKGQDLLGRNLLFLGLDEGNFRLEKDPQDAAYDLYNKARTRMSSRLLRRPGYHPGLCVLASSAADETAFTERVTKEISNSGDAITRRIIRLPIYRAKPDLEFASWWFKVIYGSNHAVPRILAGCYDAGGQPIPRTMDCTQDWGVEHEVVPEGFRYELVPGNYAKDFLRSTVDALRELAGISLGSMNRLFPTLVDWEHCLKLAQTDGVKNPAKSTLIPLSDENQDPLSNFLEHRSFLCRTGTGYAPLRHRDGCATRTWIWRPPAPQGSLSATSPTCRKRR